MPNFIAPKLRLPISLEINSVGYRTWALLQDRVFRVSIAYTRDVSELRHHLPDEVYSWIRDFLNSPSHCSRFAGEVHSRAGVTASVIQGSSFGPASYIVNAADLSPKHDGHVITKFADDI